MQQTTGQTRIRSHRTPSTRTIAVWTGYALLIAYCIVDLYPMVWVALTSLKNNVDIFGNPFGLPVKWLWHNYVDAWKIGRLAKPYSNSALIAALTVSATLMISTTAAYVLERFRVRAKGAISLLISVGIFVPQQAVLLPLLLFLKQLGQINRPWTLAVVYTAYNLSISFFIISSFMRQIPHELEEAAVIDGSSFNQAFFRIILPITMPGVSTAATLVFLNSWNEFMFANIYTSTPKLATLPVAMATFNNQYSTEYAYIAATVMLALVPILTFFIIFQKYVVRGLTTGAVKG